jgi:hypothetical protein
MCTVLQSINEPINFPPLHKTVVVSGCHVPDMCPAHITTLLKLNIYHISYINNLLQKNVPAAMLQTGSG